MGRAPPFCRCANSRLWWRYPGAPASPGAAGLAVGGGVEPARHQPARQAGRLIGAARIVNADALTLDWRRASARVVARCRRAGLRVLVWTVDDLSTMPRLKAAGVDGITSNRPDLLRQL